jgi:NAD(P)-dependent dehydrogenase (short-subunit alcohol dehydrogenase family)
MTQRTLIRTPFTAASTAADVIAGVDLTGRRAIVTGATSGIGTETARALASVGADVTLAVRRAGAGAEAAEQISASTGNRRVHVQSLDLTSRDSVDAFAAAWDGPLHILVNNAGIMAPPAREVTADGVELQFAVNYLSPFTLTLGLHSHLAEAGDARIVSAARTATLVIATIRGLLLDLLATGDQARVQDAAETFLAGLEQAQPRGAPGPGELPGGQC